MNKETKNTHVSRLSGFDCSMQVGWLSYHPRIQAFPFPRPNTESFKATWGIQKERSTISDYKSVQKDSFQVVESNNACCVCKLDFVQSCSELY